MTIDWMLDYEVGVVNFDTGCGNTFGRMRVHLRKHGIEVNAVDLMIASTALTHDLVLVTHNTSDFNRIPGLVLDDWLL
jgi:tRNA(fMet)-specific endonuclease VapC